MPRTSLPLGSATGSTVVTGTCCGSRLIASHNKYQCLQVYLPLSYLYGMKATGELTPLVQSLREELYTKEYSKIDWNAARNQCAKEDLYYPHPWYQVPCPLVLEGIIHIPRAGFGLPFLMLLFKQLQSRPLSSSSLHLKCHNFSHPSKILFGRLQSLKTIQRLQACCCLMPSYSWEQFVPHFVV